MKIKRNHINSTEFVSTEVISQIKSIGISSNKLQTDLNRFFYYQSCLNVYYYNRYNYIYLSIIISIYNRYNHIYYLLRYNIFTNNFVHHLNVFFFVIATESVTNINKIMKIKNQRKKSHWSFA